MRLLQKLHRKFFISGVRYGVLIKNILIPINVKEEYTIKVAPTYEFEEKTICKLLTVKLNP